MKQLFVFSGYEFITLGVFLLLSCHEQAGFYVLVRRPASDARITGTSHVANFLGVFAKSRSERISLLMPVRIYRRGPRWTDFHEI